MLAKREKLKEKMYENQKQTKKQKKTKNVEGIPNICLSCLLWQLLVFKSTFSMKRKQKLKSSF